MANQEQPLSAYNVFHELQQEICDVLNKSQILTANNVQFFPENRCDIDYQIKNSLKKQGIACVCLTPNARYLGHTGTNSAYQLDDLTLQIVEYTPINRAKNQPSVITGLDLANYCAEILAGPNSVIGFGNINTKSIEQGEDNGLLVTKAIFQTALTNGQQPIIYVPFVTKEELSAAIEDLSATVDSRLSITQSRWGNIAGDLSDQTDLKLALDGLSDAIDINTSNINEISTGLESVQNELATTSALLSDAVDGLSNAIDGANEAVEALAESKADKTELSDYARKANTSIDYNSTTKKITLDADGYTTQIDATAFIKDGMVDNARYDEQTKMIVITFNTDAGKEPISVDVAALFNQYTAGTGLILDDAEFSVDTTVIAQKSDLEPYALSADVDSRLTAKADLTSIGNGTLTIKQGTTTLGTFTANQNTGTTVTIPAQQAPSWGQITGNLTAQTDLKNALDAKADSTDLEPYALSADVDSRLTAKADLTAIGDATVTINQDGVQKAQFTLNQKNNVTVNLEKGDEAAWGNITGEISAQTDLKQELDNRYTVIATWSE